MLGSPPLSSPADPPSLSVLQHFPVKNGFIDIPQKIGGHYKNFGMLLLNDDDGNKVTNIEISKRGNPVDITVEILYQWRQGKGKLPVTWQTLVECLRATSLNVLADEIDQFV